MEESINISDKIDRYILGQMTEVEKTAFEAEIEALRDTEIDDISPVSLSEADFLTSSDFPTTNEMIALEHIINFED